MSKYKMWDKTSDIYTLGRDKETGKAHFTAQEYIERFAPWAAQPNAKIIVGGGVVNGTCFLEFDSFVSQYEKMGCDFSGCETDDDVLAKIEEFENTPVENAPTAEERIAAALEFQALSSMEDVEVQ